MRFARARDERRPRAQRHRRFTTCSPAISFNLPPLRNTRRSQSITSTDEDRIRTEQPRRGVASLETLLNDSPAGRWLMMSDLCKHCSAAHPAIACPTGALIINEFSNVYVQNDICNGCGYCVAVCPFGVIARSPIHGHAHKSTVCYDRRRDDMTQRAPRRARPDRFSSDPSTYSKHVMKARGPPKSTMRWLGTAFVLSGIRWERRPCLRSRQVPAT
jgi:Fe-S-cluster-containing dehydrogenase component